MTRKMTQLGALLASATLVATGLAATQPSSAEPINAESTDPDVLITVDPSYQNPDFEGWGTSLIWFANATGDYPEEIREELYELIFGQEGMRLNIARYNVGGGNAPDVPDYLRPGGAVEGWWAAPEGTTRTDKDWWDPDNPEHWNEDADATQRWWVERIKADITRWEAFSNSPPWFHTISGYTSGGFEAREDNIREESMRDFAAYMVGAVERLEEAHGITIDTIDPMNEPNTSYWSTQLGVDGNPTGGRQEGAYVSLERQGPLLDALIAELAEEDTRTDALVSAMDQTNPFAFARDWASYEADTRAGVSQMNVHTYGTTARTSVRDLAKIEDKPLWMSEFGGSWGIGQDFVSMESGLGQAQHIIDDLRLLEADAWLFWQTVEDYDNMAPGGETPMGMNWGEIQIPFDCTEVDTLGTCPIRTNSKFDTVRNFTHYIEPGSTIVATDDTNTTAAINASGEGVSVVHVNDSTEERTLHLDLNGFADTAGATVTPILTTKGSPLVTGESVEVIDGVAELVVPAQSVVTLEVSEVSGVSEAAAMGQEGHLYRLVSQDSGLALSDGLILKEADLADASQSWTIERTSGGYTNNATYTLTSIAGQALTAPDGSDEWVLSTPGDGTFTIVNPSAQGLLEASVEGGDVGDSVGVAPATSEVNQVWRIEDVTIQEVTSPEVATLVGVLPALPTELSATTVEGATATVVATWDDVSYEDVANTGSFSVRGSFTDVAGTVQDVTATVAVIVGQCVQDGHTTAAPGLLGDLPTTVSVIGTDPAAGAVRVPVVWDTVPVDAVADLGLVEIGGTATMPDSTEVPVSLLIDVIEAIPAPMPDKPIVSATFVEPGYGTDGLVDGVLTDKAWSNWKSSNKNSVDTLTATFDSERRIHSATWYFYAEGNARTWPSQIQVEALVGDQWQPVGDEVSVGGQPGAGPVVTVPIGINASEVRFRFTAHPNTHMLASEVTFEGIGGIDPVLPDRDLDCTEINPVVPTETPTAEPTAPTPAGDLYSTPGFHSVNGRWWHTECEPYSQTFRCHTDIWATQTVVEDGSYVSRNGWVFNNLTYLPHMTRAAWSANPLGHAGTWVAADGREWRTVCDTAETGRNGCRSYVKASYIASTLSPGNVWIHYPTEGWVFNNIVRFQP